MTAFVYIPPLFVLMSSLKVLVQVFVLPDGDDISTTNTNSALYLTGQIFIDYYNLICSFNNLAFLFMCIIHFYKYRIL